MKGHKLLAEEKLMLRELIIEGKSYDEIIKVINVSKPSLSRFVKKENLIYKSPNLKKYDYTYIDSLLRQGKKPLEISRILNVPYPSIGSISKKLGYNFLKDHGNIRYFQFIDSKIKAYLLGFIAADGYVVKNSNSSSITFGVQINERDREILDLLKKEIGCENKVHLLKSKMVRFTITDSSLIKDLYSLGITQRKSKTLCNVLQNIPEEYAIDFIAGYFDGDGSVSFTNNLNRTTTYIFFRGTKELLQAFIPILNLKNYYFHFNKTWILSFAKKEEVYNFYLNYKSSAYQLDRKIKKLELRITKILLKYPNVQTISSTYIQ
jgi:hypothetical protein